MSSVSDALTSYYLVCGGARHLFYLTPDQTSLASKYGYKSQFFGFASAVFAKTSVALFLLRIIGLVSTWRKRFIYGNLLLYCANHCCYNWSWGRQMLTSKVNMGASTGLNMPESRCDCEPWYISGW